jgi:arabinogalactan endo-1,4-beta-galactosidase
VSRLIIPGVNEPREDERLLICRVPTGPETICGKLFPERQLREWQRHTGLCAREHMDAIRERAPSERLKMLDHPDPEYAEHMRKVGEQMRAEGRWETKPNER